MKRVSIFWSTKRIPWTRSKWLNPLNVKVNVLRVNVLSCLVLFASFLQQRLASYNNACFTLNKRSLDVCQQNDHTSCAQPDTATLPRDLDLMVSVVDLGMHKATGFENDDW